MKNNAYGLSNNEATLLLIENEVCKIKHRSDGAIVCASKGKIESLKDNLKEIEIALDNAKAFLKRLE